MIDAFDGTVTESTETLGIRSYSSTVVCYRTTTSGESKTRLPLFSEKVVRDDALSASEQVMEGQKIYFLGSSTGVGEVRAAKKTAGLLVETMRLAGQSVRDLIHGQLGGAQWDEKPDGGTGNTVITAGKLGAGVVLEFHMSPDGRSLLRFRQVAGDGKITMDRTYHYGNGLDKSPNRVEQTIYTFDQNGARVPHTTEISEILSVTPAGPETIDNNRVAEFFKNANPDRIIDTRDGGKEKGLAELHLR